MAYGVKKSNKSSIVIIPPEEAWPQIQEIRSVHDKSFKRWMPHINLQYPFVEDDKDGKNFDYAASKIKEMIQRNALKHFTISFSDSSLNYFKHKNNCTLFLEPFNEQGEANEHIANIQKFLQEEFPDFDDLSKISDQGYQPHLSLGQLSHSEIETKRNMFKDSWKESRFVVKSIYIISRKNFESPFEIRHQIDLLS